MVKKRCDPKVEPKLPFWKPEGKLWCADPVAMQEAITASGKTELQLRTYLGAGYPDLLEVLKGKKVDNWTAVHIEGGITNTRRHPA